MNGNKRRKIKIKNLSNENVIHIIKDDAEYIQFRRLLEYEDIVKHCFSCKTSINDNFDFSGNSDTMEKTINNYKIICNYLNLSYKNVVRPTQTHTDTIVSLESKYTQDIEVSPKQLNDVDGLITNKPNIILSTRYADCTPLFFFDPVKKVIASVHSGWKGTVKKIGLKTINKMVKEYESSPENIIVCIGPTIRGCHFEVSDDVREMFENAFGIDEKMIKTSVDEGKYYIDSVYANMKTFYEAGIKKENIIDSGICTVCNKDKFFSFRGNNKESGRMAALICLI